MHTMTQLPADKPTAYAELETSLRALLEGEHDLVANAANLAALLFWSLPQLNWAGFYLVEPRRGDLLLGPFQGKPACVRIPIGRGVCGTAAARRETSSCPTCTRSPATSPATRRRIRRSSCRSFATASCSVCSISTARCRRGSMTRMLGGSRRWCACSLIRSVRAFPDSLRVRRNRVRLQRSVAGVGFASGRDAASTSM